MTDRPVEYNENDFIQDNVNKLNQPTNLIGTNVDRPYVYNSTVDSLNNTLVPTDASSSLTGTNIDRPARFDDIINIQGDLLLVDVNSSYFNPDSDSVVMPIDLSSVFYNSLQVVFKQKNNSSFLDSGLQYNFPYYLKKFNNSNTIIELYYDKKLTNKVDFINSGVGVHQLSVRINPYKFQSENLLPYNRTLEDLNIEFTDIFNHLVQLESDDPTSFEKILQDISSKYVSYFDLGDDIITELISEFGYDYLTDIGLNLGTSELSTFYSYLKLIHLLKGSRQGLEFVFQLLGYEAKLVEWWEMPNLSVFPLGEPDTFDIIIKIVNQPTLTLLQSGKIRVFTKYYVYPLLRYIIQDILLEFAGLGLGNAGYVDKLFYFDSTFNTLIVSSGGYNDLFYDTDDLTPNFEAIIPFQYDNAEGDTGFITLGQTFDYLVLDNNVINGVIIYLSNPALNGNVQFSLKINNVLFVPQVNLTMIPSQTLLNYSITAIINAGDVLTLTVETLDPLDTAVGDSIIWGLYG